MDFLYIKREILMTELSVLASKSQCLTLSSVAMSTYVMKLYQFVLKVFLLTLL